MSGPARIKGNKLSLLVNATELRCEITNVVLDSREAESGATTYCDAAEGGSFESFFTIGALQSTAVGAFWSYLWANPGAEVPFRYAPHENAVATAEQPHVLGVLRIPGKKPTLGGPAGTDDFTFETELVVVGETTLDRGASAVPLVTGASPAGQSELEQIVVTGTRFTGTTGVTIDGETAAFNAVGDTILVVILPEGTAGEVPIVVTNATGASVEFDYTAAA